MTTSIPLGFHTVSFSFRCAGSTHNIVTTISGKNNTYLTAASINNVYRLAFCNSGRPFNAAQMGTNYSLVEQKCIANIGGLLNVDINATLIAGSGTLDTPSVNTAMLINKPTGFAGRPYRGRMFVPPLLAETNISPAGIILPATVTIINATWLAVYNDLKVTNGIDPVLLHDDALALVPTAISAFTVSSRIGTIGRRMRR